MAFIIAASCSRRIIEEWKKVNSGFYAHEIHHDYALMKVLYHLRRHNNANTYINHIQWTGNQPPLNFNNLTNDDIIYIVGHGNEQGLYAMGPNLTPKTRVENLHRLLDLLTRDGSLKRKMKGKTNPFKIVILSCRSGLGFYISLAQRLYKLTGKDVITEGAVGFTFGSPRTLALAHNEVLIYGLPWHMEYRGTIDLKTAEQATSNREKSSITYKRKKTEIDAFMKAKGDMEKDMKTLIYKIKNTDVNKALDELYAKHNKDWGALISNQFDLYSTAKVNANLEFDMWYGKLVDGYVQTTGSSISDRAMAELLNQPGVTPVSLLSEK